MFTEYIAWIKPNGLIDLDENSLKDLIGKKVKIAVVPESITEKDYKSGDIIRLLKEGPKVNFKNDLITREWIHSREDDGNLY
jgi:hypothetical protein